MDKYLNKIQIAANKFGNFSYIKAITNGVASIVPMIIIGSIYTLLNNIEFKPYMNFLKSTRLSNYLGIPNNVTMGIIALLLSFTTAYHFAKEYNQDGLASGIISMCCFLLLIPLNQLKDGSKLIPMTYLGATGMFTAMIVGLLSARIFIFLTKKNITIKMPESVPPATIKAFSALIPGFIVITIFLVLEAALKATPWESFPNAVSVLIQTPLSGIGNSVWAIILIWMLSNVAWFFGIHGIVVISVVNPILIALDLENLDHTSAGLAATHIVGKNFTNVYAGATGAGIIMGLVICMAFFAKSKQYKMVGRLSLVPDIFSVAEPAIFGTPIVLNMMLIIPFMLVPAISIAVAYFLTTMGILPVISGVQLPWSTPVIVQGFLLGGWRVALYQVFLMAFSTLVYYPFFHVLDKRAYTSELKDEMEKNESDEKKNVTNISEEVNDTSNLVKS